MKTARFKKLVIYSITCIFVSALVLSSATGQLYRRPMLGTEDSPKVIQVNPSVTAAQFAHLLKEQQLIASERLFLLLLRFKGLSHQLKAGVYEVRPGESAMDLLQRVANGDVLTRKFTIIEGSTQKKIQQDLAAANYLHYQPDDWLTIKNGHANAEGLLLADTYQYRGGSSSKILLMQAHQNLMRYLQEIWANRSPGLPYKNPYELLIAASIIEKETALAEERKLIAGVMVNRLKYHMPLQMDPTVIYGLGDGYKGSLSHNDLLIPSAYNSYMNRGLPPTPIAMVGKAALDAAAHPNWSKYLYFVAKGDGSHQFSETYEQQRQAINLYQRKD